MLKELLVYSSFIANYLFKKEEKARIIIVGVALPWEGVHWCGVWCLLVWSPEQIPIEEHIFPNQQADIYDLCSSTLIEQIIDGPECVWRVDHHGF